MSDATPPKSEKNSWVWSVLPINAGTQAFSTMSPLYILHLGGSVLDVGLIATLYNFILIPASIFWGSMTDRLARRRLFFVIASTGTMVVFLVMFLVPNIAAFAALYGLLSPRGRRKLDRLQPVGDGDLGEEELDRGLRSALALCKHRRDSRIGSRFPLVGNAAFRRVCCSSPRARPPSPSCSPSSWCPNLSSPLRVPSSRSILSDTSPVSTTGWPLRYSNWSSPRPPPGKC